MWHDCCKRRNEEACIQVWKEHDPLDCDFHDIGCEFKGIRHEVDKHIETSSTTHVRLVLAEMREIKNKLAEMQRELFEESEQRKLTMPTGEFIYMWKIDKW